VPGADDAVPARPWRPEDGPEPTVDVWPYGREPLLQVRAGGRWRLATVRAAQRYPDGRTVYQVETDPDGGGTRVVLYEWPPAGGAARTGAGLTAAKRPPVGVGRPGGAIISAPERGPTPARSGGGAARGPWEGGPGDGRICPAGGDDAARAREKGPAACRSGRRGFAEVVNA
jgi:hypothetical protein